MVAHWYFCDPHMQSHQYVSFNGGILLANLLQSSKRTFSLGSFSSFFAFKEGIWDTQISALLSSPTVSGGFVRLGGRAKKSLPKCLIRFVTGHNPRQSGA